jgi:hypothetical protein
MNKLLSGGGGGGKRSGFGSSTPNTFLALTDTPNSYATKGLNVLQVNAAENAVEFVLGKGVANGFASLDASGLLPVAQVPPLAISDFLGTVGDQVDMLALVGQNGDWCVRSDLNTVWIVIATPSSDIANWKQMVYPGTLAHAFGSGSHLADTVANVQTKLSDGSFITSKPGEIAVIAAKAVPTTSDLLLIEDAADANKKKSVTIATLPAAAPAAHDLAGALHNADTITNLNLKLSDGDVISTKAGEIAAIAAKAVPTTSDLLLIEDVADANNKKRITVGTLPAAAPAAHDLAGALHNADTITNLNLKLSDGDVISTKAGEIAAIAAKAVPTTSDLLLIEDVADANNKKRITVGTLPAAAPAAHDLAGALHNADTITNLNLKLSDGDVISTKAGEIAAIAAKAVPTTSDLLLIEDVADANNKKRITIASLIASATGSRVYNFSMPQQAQATLGKFSKAARSNNNEMLYTTDQANAGIQNGQIDPYVCPAAMTITSITVTLASIAVSQATVGAGPVILRLDVYRNDFSTRTLLGTISVPIDRTKCGVNNGLGLNCFQTITVTGLAIALAQGDTWGLEFLNVSTNNNCINSALGVYAVITTS